MNFIDIIENIRLKSGESMESFLSKTVVSPNMYAKYRAKEANPGHDALLSLLDAAGLRLFVVEKNMIGNANIDKWGIMDMWCRLNKNELIRTFEKITHNKCDERALATIMACLYTVWFYKTHKSMPESSLSNVINRDLSKRSNLYAWALINITSPTEKAYEFYNEVQSKVQEYLITANIIDEITL